MFSKGQINGLMYLILKTFFFLINDITIKRLREKRSIIKAQQRPRSIVWEFGKILNSIFFGLGSNGFNKILSRNQDPLHGSLVKCQTQSSLDSATRRAQVLISLTRY